MMTHTSIYTCYVMATLYKNDYVIITLYKNDYVIIT